MLLRVSIKYVYWLVESTWMQRQAGERVILTSVPKLPWAPLAAEVLLYEQEKLSIFLMISSPQFAFLWPYLVPRSDIRALVKE